MLIPTKIYCEPVVKLLQHLKSTRGSVHALHGIAHITGGGILDNLPRVLPESLAARIEGDSWHRPAIFNWLQDNGHIGEQEMMRTFNCGIGMIAAVRSAEVEVALDTLNRESQCAQVIGEVIARVSETNTLQIR